MHGGLFSRSPWMPQHMKVIYSAEGSRLACSWIKLERLPAHPQTRRQSDSTRRRRLPACRRRGPSLGSTGGRGHAFGGLRLVRTADRPPFRPCSLAYFRLTRRSRFSGSGSPGSMNKDQVIDSCWGSVLYASTSNSFFLFCTAKVI